MKIHAVIFDVYNTLLTVEPGQPDVDAGWADLCCNFFQEPPRLTWKELGTACDAEISRRQLQARDMGIRFPEIIWPDIIRTILPEWRRLPSDHQSEFLFRHAQLARSVKINPQAAQTLPWLKQHGILLGILSNAQDYTLRELDQALRAVNLDRSLFEPWLCFWSFENGFSKPDPHCFRLLTQRLSLRHIHPEQTLMIGDRLDNDIEPARRFGIQTWHLAMPETSKPQGQGDWEMLHEWLIQPGRCIAHTLSE
jgi:FMN phosphatase YigB (HAD superfamily)